MKALLAAVALLSAAPVAAAQVPPPIIDMHMHAMSLSEVGPMPQAMCTPFLEFPVWDPQHPYDELFLQRVQHPGCPDPVWAPATDEALLADTVAAMERLNIYGVLSGPPERMAAFRAASDRFIPGLYYNMETATPPERIRAMHAAGDVAVIGEVTTQYEGIEPADPRLEPMWALAEELDIPVGIHVGTGPFGVIYMGATGYRARMHSALTMEEVLVRHPRLRVYLMHAGYPMIDDLLTVLYAHPQVHVDVGVIVYTQPRAAFYRYLERIVEAGFTNRILFGSDQMVWPGVIERSVAVIEEAPFLSAGQKRDILYNNAARFLRLTPEQIAAHHRGVATAQ
jgi:uncharacterized protein